MIVSTMMTIWKWPLAQTILDGYSFIKHLIAFNETHIAYVDDVGTIGVKKNKLVVYIYYGEPNISFFFVFVGWQ
jgi:hypothetical protein